MKIKILIVVASIFTAGIFVSGGYGYWEKELKIEGIIKVVPNAELSNQPLVNPLGEEMRGENGTLLGSEQSDSVDLSNVETAPTESEQLEQSLTQGNNSNIDETPSVERIDGPDETESLAPEATNEPENNTQSEPAENVSEPQDNTGDESNATN